MDYQLQVGIWNSSTTASFIFIPRSNPMDPFNEVTIVYRSVSTLLQNCQSATVHIRGRQFDDVKVFHFKYKLVAVNSHTGYILASIGVTIARGN